MYSRRFGQNVTVVDDGTRPGLITGDPAAIASSGLTATTYSAAGRKTS
jgi:hypothetical protein